MEKTYILTAVTYYTIWINISLLCDLMINDLCKENFNTINKKLSGKLSPLFWQCQACTCSPGDSRFLGTCWVQKIEHFQTSLPSVLCVFLISMWDGHKALFREKRGAFVAWSGEGSWVLALSVYLCLSSMHPSIHPSLPPSVHVFLHLFIHLFNHPSIQPASQPTIYPSI